ncbi:hydrolase [Rhodococcus sp. IITR03]|nr:hydrolase [Rhodococcus sp. IITR03]
MSSTRFSVGTFDIGNGSFPGLVVADAVYDIRAFTRYLTTSDVLDDWEAAFTALSEFADTSSDPGTPISQVRTLPPVSRPGVIYGAGANYREHIIQMAVAHKLGTPGLTDEQLAEEAARDIDHRKAHGEPYVWTGVPSAISGAYDDIVLPTAWDDHDWELELGVVIGRRARRVAVADALDHVAGYTICNDLTTRSLVPRRDIAMMGTDWMRAKNFPTFYPTGPWLVPAAFVPDPLDLKIRLRLNGETMQDSSTGDMVFGPAELISYISRFVDLEPGDMVITGSPPGNGSHWGRYLQAGDVLESEIEGLGIQRNRCRTDVDLS